MGGGIHTLPPPPNPPSHPAMPDFQPNSLCQLREKQSLEDKTAPPSSRFKDFMVCHGTHVFCLLTESGANGGLEFGWESS